jgi:hypothetical protein
MLQSDLGADAGSPVGIRVRGRRVNTRQDFLGTGLLFHPQNPQNPGNTRVFACTRYPKVTGYPSMQNLAGWGNR